MLLHNLLINMTFMLHEDLHLNLGFVEHHKVVFFVTFADLKDGIN